MATASSTIWVKHSARVHTGEHAVNASKLLSSSTILLLELAATIIKLCTVSASQAHAVLTVTLCATREKRSTILHASSSTAFFTHSHRATDSVASVRGKAPRPRASEASSAENFSASFACTIDINEIIALAAIITSRTSGTIDSDALALLHIPLLIERAKTLLFCARCARCAKLSCTIITANFLVIKFISIGAGFAMCFILAFFALKQSTAFSFCQHQAAQSCNKQQCNDNLIHL